jgi:hypothetical protein
LISGGGPTTEQQIRDKLIAEGFSNIQISQQGNLFETTATKGGRSNGRSIPDRGRSSRRAALTTTVTTIERDLAGR